MTQLREGLEKLDQVTIAGGTDATCGVRRQSASGPVCRLEHINKSETADRVNNSRQPTRVAEILRRIGRRR